MLNCQKRFYENLYSDNIPIDEVSIETVLGDNPNKLNRDEAEKREGEISYITETSPYSFGNFRKL